MRARLRSLLACASTALAAAPSPAFAGHEPGTLTVRVDDDSLALAERDRDYTAGLTVTFVDPAPAGSRPLPLARPLDRIDDWLGVHASGTTERRALELGLRLFTPGNLRAEAALPNDRPYATLVYVAGSRLDVDAPRGVATQSSLTLGVLGLPIVGGFHRFFHHLLRSPLPGGYAHQISNGGEPTFDYALTRERLLAGARAYERPWSLRAAFGASVGYATEARAELALRAGSLRTAWWSALPLPAEYAGQPAMAGPIEPRDTAQRGVVFEAAIGVRARLYDALLEGQFRDSDVTLAPRELERGVLEARFGFATVLRTGLTLSYTFTAQSQEIARGGAARSYTWGSLAFVQRF